MKRAYVVLLAVAGCAAAFALARQIKPMPKDAERLGAVAPSPITGGGDLRNAAELAAAATPDPCQARCEPMARTDAGMGAASYFRCVTACKAAPKPHK